MSLASLTGTGSSVSNLALHNATTVFRRWQLGRRLPYDAHLQHSAARRVDVLTLTAAWSTSSNPALHNVTTGLTHTAARSTVSNPPPHDVTTVFRRRQP